VVVATVGIVMFVPESPVLAPGRINPLGGILLAGWLIPLLVAVSQDADWG
jgi:hypothetical protein